MTNFSSIVSDDLFAFASRGPFTRYMIVSGHGTQVDDKDWDEVDGKDEGK